LAIEINMAFISPQQIIKQFGIEHGMSVADFGVGSGHYTLAVAEYVGSIGKVYAIDVQKELLERIKKQAIASGYLNVEIVTGDLEKEGGSKLADESVDFVILSNILFQVKNRRTIVKEVLRVLKKGGKVAIIDWSKVSPLGLPAEMIFTKDKASQMFMEEGFIMNKEVNTGDMHYGLVFKKT